MLATYPSTNFESSYPPRQIHHHSQQRQQHPSPHSQPQSQPQIQAYLDSQSLSQYHQQLQLQQSSQPQQQPQPLPSPPRSQFDDTTADPTLYSFAGEPASLFDFHPSAQHNSTPLMQADHTNSSWLPNNSQRTPTTTGRAHHHRESSLSSLGSAGPASPYTVNIATPQIAGDQYHEYYDYQQPYKPLTPIHTPSQDQFLTPHYYPTNAAQQLAYLMAPEGSLRPSMASVASHDSPSTPPAFESDDRQKHGGYRSMPKLDRTMTDVYADELYSPNFQITSAPATQPVAVTTTSPQNDVFTQRLQAANSQHLRSNAPLMIPARERSPFRQGSPLAPVGNGFGAQASANARFGTATHMREQQKAENDARALQQQIQRTSPKESTPTTISPKDVDLVYRENEDDSNTPLFPAPQSQHPKGRSPNTYRTTPAFKQEPSELDDTVSQQSFGSMATTVRRESSSGYSASSQPSSQQRFAPPAVPGGVVTRQIPQQYPFVPQTHREMSNVSNVTTASLARTETTDSSQSDYVPEPASSKKPAGAAADTGTYTCTYHGCTLRFETPAKLQRHKREGHRNSASLPIGSNGSGGETGEEGGMTSAAFRNTQNGPHKCERINPSTGKPCNTIFSRPYDLTRHEDTIHNARKQKVRCHLCTEEKTFSRNDALTRHFRVCHPEHTELIKGRRRVGRD